MKFFLGHLTLFLSFFSFSNINQLISLDVESTINPATVQYIEKAIEKADKDDQVGLLIKVNTPGGLVSSAKSIMTLFGESRSPVVVWVSPSGASATSAGAFIAVSSDVAVMAEGTNMGASTPVKIGKDIQTDLKAKSINDLVALVKSLAILHGRNHLPFEEMIKTAKSFTAKELINEKSIDLIANNERELVEKLSSPGFFIQKDEKKFKLSPDTTIKHLPRSLIQKLMDIICNPSLSYLLFIMALALFYMEFQAPGGFILGSAGAVALVFYLASLQLIGFSGTGVLLILLSFVFFILEIFITSFGLLSIIGTVSLVIGSFLFFDTPDLYIKIPKTLIFSTIGSIVSVLLFFGIFLYKTMRKESAPLNSLQGKKGKVTEVIDSQKNIYRIKCFGEIWRAQSKNALALGDEIEVIQSDPKSMKLYIKKYQE